jgi:hypothetical protein
MLQLRSLARTRGAEAHCADTKRTQINFKPAPKCPGDIGSSEALVGATGDNASANS